MKHDIFFSMSQTPDVNGETPSERQMFENYFQQLKHADKLGFEACFFVMIRTSEHDLEWQENFLQALKDRPQVQEAHRLAGDIDYILKVRVKNARAYDEFYQALISEVKVHNVTALLSMEEIKSTVQLPLGDINFAGIR